MAARRPPPARAWASYCMPTESRSTPSTASPPALRRTSSRLCRCCGAVRRRSLFAAGRFGGSGGGGDLLLASGVPRGLCRVHDLRRGLRAGNADVVLVLLVLHEPL